MYPSFIACEVVLVNENLHFFRGGCDARSFSACLHPSIRNVVESMDFGSSALNKYYNIRNGPDGSRHATSDMFTLATTVPSQGPIQHFVLAPSSLTDAPAWAMGLMKTTPLVWDEAKLVDGYPGKYILLARHHADAWYIARVNV